MYRYQQILGLRVVGKVNGKVLGTVAGLVVDPDHKQVRWLSLNSGGRYDGRHWICVDDVTELDSQAVTINRETSIRAPEEALQAEQWVRSGRRLIGQEVVTEKGQGLGKVGDYEFVTDTFALIKLIIPPGDGIWGNALSFGAEFISAVSPAKIVVAEKIPTPRDKAAAPVKRVAVHKPKIRWHILIGMRRHNTPF